MILPLCENLWALRIPEAELNIVMKYLRRGRGAQRRLSGRQGFSSCLKDSPIILGGVRKMEKCLYEKRRL